jgi:hypothetical protein
MHPALFTSAGELSEIKLSMIKPCFYLQFYETSYSLVTEAWVLNAYVHILNLPEWIKRMEWTVHSQLPALEYMVHSLGLLLFRCINKFLAPGKFTKPVSYLPAHMTRLGWNFVLKKFIKEIVKLFQYSSPSKSCNNINWRFTDMCVWTIY